MLQVSVYEIIAIKCKTGEGRRKRKGWEEVQGRRKGTEGRHDVKGLGGEPDTNMLYKSRSGNKAAGEMRVTWDKGAGRVELDPSSRFSTSRWPRAQSQIAHLPKEMYLNTRRPLFLCHCILLPSQVGIIYLCALKRQKLELST